MSPAPNDILVHLLKNNHGLIHELVDGISQEESLLQLPFEGNCLNWVVGHILDAYHTSQDWLGAPLSPGDEIFAQKYGYGSKPMTDPANACSLAEMLKKLDTSLLIITSQLECVPPIELESLIELWMGPVTKIEALYFMLWHITYHTGQLEQLQKLGANKN